MLLKDLLYTNYYGLKDKKIIKPYLINGKWNYFMVHYSYPNLLYTSNFYNKILQFLPIILLDNYEKKLVNRFIKSIKRNDYNLIAIKSLFQAIVKNNDKENLDKLMDKLQEPCERTFRYSNKRCYLSFFDKSDYSLFCYFKNKYHPDQHSHNCLIDNILLNSLNTPLEVFKKYYNPEHRYDLKDNFNLPIAEFLVKKNKDRFNYISYINVIYETKDKDIIDDYKNGLCDTDYLNDFVKRLKTFEQHKFQNILHSGWKINMSIKKKLLKLGYLDVIEDLDTQTIYKIQLKELMNTERYDELITLNKKYSNNIFDLVYCYKNSKNKYMRKKLEEYFKSIKN